MEREIVRERMLPAFSIGIGDLEELVLRISALFENPAATDLSITASVDGETQTFGSVDALKKWAGVKNWVTHFSFWLAQGGGTVAILSASPPFESKAMIRVTGPTEWWASDVAEQAYAYLQTRKVPHKWLAGAPRRWLMLLIFPIFNMGALVLLKGSIKNPIVLDGWLATSAALATLFFFRDRLFPTCVLRIGPERNLIRRHGSKVILSVALLSLTVNLVAWYLPEESPPEASPASYGPAYVHIETADPQNGPQQNQNSNVGDAHR